MLNTVSIQTRPCNLSCMHMQHLFYYLMPVFQVIVSEKAYYISSISNHIDHAILKSEDEKILK